MDAGEQKTEPPFPDGDPADLTEQHVIIAGVGLIGGSIAAAIRHRAPHVQVTGVGRDASRLQAAQAAGLLTDIATELTPDHLRAPALVVVCLPVHLIADFVMQTAAVAGPETLMTDAGSVKASICQAVASDPRAAQAYVAAHPIAGGEQSGFEHAEADLFAGRTCVVIPPADDRQMAARFQRVCRFWRALGCEIREMSAQEHDRVLALTSHLPHLMAAATTSAVGPERLPLTGSGFRDTTRIAAGSAALWRSILCGNREQVIHAIDDAQALLAEFRQALSKESDERLEELLQAAVDCRSQLS